MYILGHGPSTCIHPYIAMPLNVPFYVCCREVPSSCGTGDLGLNVIFCGLWAGPIVFVLFENDFDFPSGICQHVPYSHVQVNMGVDHVTSCTLQLVEYNTAKLATPTLASLLV